MISAPSPSDRMCWHRLRDRDEIKECLRSIIKQEWPSSPPRDLVKWRSKEPIAIVCISTEWNQNSLFGCELHKPLHIVRWYPLMDSALISVSSLIWKVHSQYKCHHNSNNCFLLLTQLLRRLLFSLTVSRNTFTQSENIQEYGGNCNTDPCEVEPSLKWLLRRWDCFIYHFSVHAVCAQVCIIFVRVWKISPPPQRAAITAPKPQAEIRQICN